MRIAIVATGASVTDAVCATLVGLPCIAVNNAGIDTLGEDGIIYPARVKNPVALAAQDHEWWAKYPGARELACPKFSANHIPGVEHVQSDYVLRPSSSGVLALEVARRLGAKHIDLYGYDNHGPHYFGRHPKPMGQTSAGRFAIFETQLAALGGEMKKAGIRIVNRSPISTLRCFERAAP